MEGFQCILTIKLYLIRILKRIEEECFRGLRCVGNKLQFIFQQRYDLVTGMEATLVFASPASSSQERGVAIMRRDAEWLQPGPKQSGLWQLIVSRLEICHCHQPVRSVRSAPVKSSLKCPYSYLCQRISRSLMCTKARTFLFSKDQNICEQSQKYSLGLSFFLG